MKLEWQRVQHNSENVEYRAWGVLVPYRVLMSCGWITVQQYGTGREPSTAHMTDTETVGFIAGSILAQMWEDEHQQVADKVGTW